MKILHIVTYAAHGGAGIAARRLHEALISNGIESYILCADLDETNIVKINPLKKCGAFLSKVFNLFCSIPNYYALKIRFAGAIQYSFNGRKNKRLQSAVKRINPDIIHLHWVNDGFLDVKQLLKFDKPVVWSCHDMWAFTGGCHYNGDCMKWKTGCTQCPLLEGISRKDLARKESELKEEALHSIPKIRLVGLSNWMNESIKESKICCDLPASCIPNTIDEKTFLIVSKEEARTRLGISGSVLVILFGAMDLADERKGFKYLIEALTILSKDVEYKAIAVGNVTRELSLPSETKVKIWGKAKNKEEMNLLYSAADVVVLPSVQENLSNMIIEALLSGTPVAGFEIGGNGDMVLHQDNGYLSKEISGGGLAKAIKWILENQILPQHCRETILDRFDNKKTVNKYIQLYKELIS